MIYICLSVCLSRWDGRGEKGERGKREKGNRERGKAVSLVTTYFRKEDRVGVISFHFISEKRKPCSISILITYTAVYLYQTIHARMYVCMYNRPPFLHLSIPSKTQNET